MSQNNYSILPFYESLNSQHHRKSYAYDEYAPVTSEVNQLPPFQIIVQKDVTVDSIKLVRISDGQEFEIIDKLTAVGFEKEAQNDQDFDVLKYPSRIRFSGDLFEVGYYYAVILGASFVRYSDVFCMSDYVGDLVRLEFCHSENIPFSGGLISYENNFKNYIYFNTEIGKPKYEYEERVTRREGFNFPLQQISFKRHQFEVFLNEETIDLLRLVRLHDFVKLYRGNDVFDVDEIIVTANWLEVGDIARVEFEIQTDTVVVVNGRGNSTQVECEIPEGICFDNDYNTVSKIEFQSAEYNGGYYIDNDTGQQVSLQTGDYIVQSISNSVFSVRQYNGVNYDAVTLNDQEITFDANNNEYYSQFGSNLRPNLIQINDSVINGTIVPSSTVEIWVRDANSNETIIEIGTAEELNQNGIPFIQPAGAKQVQVRAGSPNCGTYWISAWFTFEFPCSFNIQGVYSSIQAAETAGVQDDEFFVLDYNNSYGMPAPIVMQLNPSTAYNSDGAARSAQGNDSCYAVTQNNIYGLAKGVLRFLQGDTAVYQNDSEALAAGFNEGDIYAWDASGTGQSILLKMIDTDQDPNSNNNPN